MQETGSSIPLQFGQVGIHQAPFEEAQGVVIPLQSLGVSLILGRRNLLYLLQCTFLKHRNGPVP